MVSDEPRRVLDRPFDYIVKTDSELAGMEDGARVPVYSDPALTGDGLLGLVDRLYDVGIITFRRRARSKIGLFCVSKKSGGISDSYSIVGRRTPSTENPQPLSSLRGGLLGI